MSERLPKYKQPPVIETVLGISFQPLAFQVPHFGLFWREIKEYYQQFEVQAPLPEEHGFSGQQQITISLGYQQPRCWFINESEGWLIQIQNSRFVSNWRKGAGGVYPSYSKSKERFAQDWKKFVEFLSKENLGKPQFTLAEVSYINHIDKPDVTSDLKPFTIFEGAKKGEFLPDPSSFGINMNYPIGENQGRLQIISQPVLRAADLKEVMQLTVTAKVAVASDDVDALISAMDLGHEWVVRGFTDFTSPSMHEVWERYQ